MLVLAYICFYTGTLAFLLAGLTATGYLRGGDAKALAVIQKLVLAGVALLILSLFARGLHWHSVPLTTPSDALVLFAVFCGILIVWVGQGKMRALSAYFLLPISVVCLLNGLIAVRYLPSEPMDLPGMPLIIHVSLIFLALSLFLAASMTSVAYIVQARRLKTHHPADSAHALPPLEQLDGFLYNLIRVGYPVFVLALFLGALWARADRDLLGEAWWRAPKVLVSLVMVLFYAFAFHARQFGKLRGKKLAYLVFFGVMALLAVLLIHGALNLSARHFWSDML